MSQRKGKLSSNFRRQKNAIAKRLMQISLKVDDYVYKHKAISESDAAMYIQEVSSYKITCSQDVRSLQVIEKLTRCMKSIIAEREELKKNTHPKKYEDGTSTEELASHIITTSPVYSLPDEDRTHLTQTNLDDEEIHTYLMEVNDVDIINSYSDDKIIQANTIEANPVNFIGDADIRQDTASLSLCESEVLQVSETVIENFSQSILGNHDNTDRMLHATDMTSFNTIEEVNTKIKYVVNDTSVSDKNNTVKNDLAIAQVTKPLVIIASNSDKTTTVDDNCLQSAKTKVKIKRNATPRNKKTDANVKDSIKQKKSRKRPPKKINTTGAAVKPDMTSKCSSNKQDVSHYDTGNIPKGNVTSPADIYNENIENDLSWIENIRYVREVTATEFDPKLTNLDQDFWDNYTLPNFLDDQDFVYSP